MKRFEVGKKYMVYPYSIGCDCTVDRNTPVTMVVLKRTASTIWCEVDKNVLGTFKETHRILEVSKDQGEEAIDCGYKDHGDALYVWAGDEVK